MAYFKRMKQLQIITDLTSPTGEDIRPKNDRDLDMNNWLALGMLID